MPFEYEALVGHLYIVSGRSISAAPPGALVEVAPVKAARGREADTFFTLVLPSGDALAPTAFYERMAQTAAEQYFDSTGSVTAGLREIINYLNQNLLEYNQQHKDHAYEANLLCAVLRGDDLIIARVGSGAVVLRHQGKTETIPADLSNDEALFSAPLGVRPVPDIKLSRHKVANGTRLVLSDANIAEFLKDQILEALTADEIGMVLVKFKELARLQLTMLSVEFVPPEVESPVNAKEGSSSMEVAEAARLEAARAKAAAETNKPRQRRSPLGKTGEQIAGRAQVGLGRAAGVIAALFRVINRTIEHFFGTPEDGRRRWYTMPMAAGIAVLLPVVVVGVVVGLWVGQTGDTQYEQCIDEAMALTETARNTAPNNPSSRLTLWNTAMEAALRCDPLRPGDPLIKEVVREGQNVIDDINVIERREAILMDARQGASYSRVVIDGFDLFLLDRTNGVVYEAIISDQNVTTFSRKPSPIANMRTGENVNGFNIEEIIDIVFFREDQEIFALSTNGVLIRCKRRLTQDCQVERLLNYENWQNPVAVRMWENNLYVLDPGSNQIWRYAPGNSGNYSTPRASEYFQGANVSQASITNGVDFAIDTAGVIFVLLSDGSILRYESGERIAFSYGGFPNGQEIDAGTAMFLDDSPIFDGLLVTNRQNRTIYEVGRGGTHRNSFRVFDESLFATLSGAVISPGSQIIYAISGNSVFALEQRDRETETANNLP
jgi:hypothetical protein